MQRLGLTTVALVPANGHSLWSTELPGPLVLLVGSEAAGLDPELIHQADLPITIPMASSTESLNATVAASIVLFELQRRRRQPSGS